MGVRRRTLLRSVAAGGVATAGVGASTGTAEAIELDCVLSGGFFGGDGAFSTTDVTIESFDGTEIEATVYEPDAEGPHPAVLTTHGWGMSKEFLECTAATYADNGYVVLAYDSRGFGGSDGEVQVNGPNEVGDAQALLDWLADHDAVIADGDDPVVGMDGGSYGGGIQLLTAAQDDRVDAIVPRIAWNDLVASGAPNGAIKSGWLTLLVGAGSISSRLTGDVGESLDSDLQNWYLEAMAENVMPEAAIDYFEERSPTQYLAEIEAPTLVISGWKDTLFPPSEAVANYREVADAGVESRLIMYGGGHNIAELGVGDGQHEYVNRAALDWMDRHLKGADVDVVPEVSLWDEQTETWRTYDSVEEGVDRRTVTLSDLDGETSTVSQRALWFDDTATYDLGGGFTVRGTPELSLTVEAHDAPLILFARLHHDESWVSDEQIDDQVTGFRLAETGTHELELELEPLLRELPRGESLELQLAASDPFYLDENGSATVHNDASTLTLPVADGSL